jgi:hypothetical protein
MPYPQITEQSGSRSATGLAVESAFGQAAAATTFLPMVSNGMEYDPGWFSPPLMIGTRDKQVFNLQGEAKNLGTLEGRCSRPTPSRCWSPRSAPTRSAGPGRTPTPSPSPSRSPA